MIAITHIRGVPQRGPALALALIRAALLGCHKVSHLVRKLAYAGIISYTFRPTSERSPDTKSDRMLRNVTHLSKASRRARPTVLRLPRYHPPTKSERPPGERLLVYDGECGFCSRSAAFVRRRARVPVTLVPFSELDGWPVLTTLDPEQVARSSHYVTPEGVEYHGGESITRSLRLVPFGAAAAPLDLWGLALLRELLYALVAGNRSLLSVPFTLTPP